MKHDLKQILLRIARLPNSDQRWILRQLSEKERQLFKYLQGKELLSTAKRFRKLKVAPVPQLFAVPELPAYCQVLAEKAALYIAIILEQGQYSWQEQFLRHFALETIVNPLLDSEVKHLKLATKEALFNHWEDSLPFAAYLEKGHG